jgi:hypothetical protein
LGTLTKQNLFPDFWATNRKTQDYKYFARGCRVLSVGGGEKYSA